MLVAAMRDCCKGLPPIDTSKLPLILCVSEVTRPGRQPNLEQTIVDGVHQAFGRKFAPDSSVYAYGQTSVAFALDECFRLLDKYPQVLIAGVDSLLNFATLQALYERGRILSTDNSNGFIPGEGACALLVGRPDMAHTVLPRYSNVAAFQPDKPALFSLHCMGLGIVKEGATINSGQPNRAQALTSAIRIALKPMQENPDSIGLRINSQSSEDFYAKEFAIAASKAKVSATPLWCMADTLGETGAAAGLLAIAWAYASAYKHYLPASNSLCLLAGDEGERAALSLCYGQYKP